MRLTVLMLLLTSVLLTCQTYAQPSTAPPSSLPVTALSPILNDAAGAGSCDLCRPLEGRPGSDLQHHRHPRELRQHKNAPGITKSPKRTFKSQLPHRKLDDNPEKSER